MCRITNSNKMAAAISRSRCPRVKPPQRQDLQQMFANRAKVWMELVEGSRQVLPGRLTAHRMNDHSRYVLKGVEDEVEVLEIMTPVPQKISLAIGSHTERAAPGDSGHDPCKGVLLQLGDGYHGAGGRAAAPQGWRGLAEDDGHCGRVYAVCGDDEVCLDVRAIGQMDDSLFRVDSDYLCISEKTAWRGRCFLVTSFTRQRRLCHKSQLLTQIGSIDCASGCSRYFQNLQQLQCPPIEDL